MGVPRFIVAEVHLDEAHPGLGTGGPHGHDDPSQVQSEQLHHCRLVAPVPGDRGERQRHGVEVGVAECARELPQLAFLDRELDLVDQ